MSDLVLIYTFKKFSFHTIAKGLFKQPSGGALRKSVQKICSKFTGEHPCRSAISNLQSNYIEIALEINYIEIAWVFSCKFATYFQNTFS